jgi:hypothetical protein
MKNIQRVFEELGSGGILSNSSALNNFEYYKHFIFYFLVVITCLIILGVIWGIYEDKIDYKALNEKEKAKNEEM